jgi:hypothetical protein
VRIRQVKPSFWGDSRLATMPERTRLFYIGLWMLADDGGWLRWDPVEAGRDLYGYEPRRSREKRVEAMFGELADAGRVVLYPCGHAHVPRLGEHQRLSGATKQVRSVEREHSLCPAVSRDNPHSPARNGTERNDMERGGTGGLVAAPPNGSAAGDLRDKTGIDPDEAFGPTRHLRKVS